MKYVIPRFNDIITLKQEVKLGMYDFKTHLNHTYEDLDTIILKELNYTLPIGTKFKITTQHNMDILGCRIIFGTDLYSMVVNKLYGKKFKTYSYITRCKIEKEFTEKRVRYCRFYLSYIENIEIELERKSNLNKILKVN